MNAFAQKNLRHTQTPYNCQPRLLRSLRHPATQYPLHSSLLHWLLFSAQASASLFCSRKVCIVQSFFLSLMLALSPHHSPLAVPHRSSLPSPPCCAIQSTTVLLSPLDFHLNPLSSSWIFQNHGNQLSWLLGISEIFVTRCFVGRRAMFKSATIISAFLGGF